MRWAGQSRADRTSDRVDLEVDRGDQPAQGIHP
jgi:hypothetical protein